MHTRSVGAAVVLLLLLLWQQSLLLPQGRPARVPPPARTRGRASSQPGTFPRQERHDPPFDPTSCGL
jgi:hypothetical protein